MLCCPSPAIPSEVGGDVAGRQPKAPHAVGMRSRQKIDYHKSCIHRKAQHFGIRPKARVDLAVFSHGVPPALGDDGVKRDELLLRAGMPAFFLGLDFMFGILLAKPFPIPLRRPCKNPFGNHLV